MISALILSRRRLAAGAGNVPGTRGAPGGTLRPGTLRGLRLVLALALAAWLVAGVLGAWRYVDGYVVYRGFPPPETPTGVPAGTVGTFTFFSPALGQTSRALVYVPPGYKRAVARGRRFGVMYLLHGSPGVAQNLFDAGAVASDADVLIHRHRIAPMVLVAPFGANADMEWADGSRGPYERYLLDVVHAVDAHYVTRPDRAHRVIAGDSEGAFGAANVALHHLRVFGGFQSWSGYFVEQGTGTFARASRAVLDANSPLRYVPGLDGPIRRLGLHAFLYDGSGDGGAPQMREFAAQLQAAGASVVSAVYPGGHDWGLWRRQMPRALTLASHWLSAPGVRGAAR
jgi:enterochelin esterase-like enzyme